MHIFYYPEKKTKRIVVIINSGHSQIQHWTYAKEAHDFALTCSIVVFMLKTFFSLILLLLSKSWNESLVNLYKLLFFNFFYKLKNVVILYYNILSDKDLFSTITGH